MGLFSSPAKKLRKEATHLVHLATKVVHYRKDLLAEAAIVDIERDRDALIEQINAKPIDQTLLKERMERLDKTLTPHGGTIYPVTFMSENIEMILVAAILAIGVRSFFLQPFKIPTNSMYPTYAGMVGEVYPAGEDSPNAAERAFRFVQLGASHYESLAPATGRVEVPFFRDDDELRKNGAVAFEVVKGKKYFVLPAQKRKYTFAINGQPFSVIVPGEFNLDDVVAKAFFPGQKTIRDVFGSLSEENYARLQSGKGTLVSDISFDQGTPAIDFDILTGDMLFVDRISYNFVRPEVGDPFVFRTNNIVGLQDAKGNPDEKYYIKRLVGVPGDTLEVKEPVLYRNGEPITGVAAFEKNFQQEGEYPGYSYMGWLSKGDIETVPPGYFYAMGDNSPYSHDSRGWASSPKMNPYAYEDKESNGTPINMVPEKEVVGQASFIFYPFSHRWGLAE